MPKLTPFDRIIDNVDVALRSLFPPKERISKRESPAKNVESTALTPSQKKHTAGLMRVNHAGEICAQALYQGQALTAKNLVIQQQMQEAADEEIDHLAWCEQRLQELGSKPSLLNPIWYGGSLLLGLTAGLAGDKWSLGFVAETERQVTDHLKSHINKLLLDDSRTKVILEQMKTDEEEHAQTAINAGAAELPIPIKKLMSMVSKLMTKTSYYV